MQNPPTTTHYSTSSSTYKQETLTFLYKQCWVFFTVVIITIPSLSNIHQSAAFDQKPYNPNRKDIYNHKETGVDFHKQKVRGRNKTNDKKKTRKKKTSMRLFVKMF